MRFYLIAEFGKKSVALFVDFCRAVGSRYISTYNTPVVGVFGRRFAEADGFCVIHRVSRIRIDLRIAVVGYFFAVCTDVDFRIPCVFRGRAGLCRFAAVGTCAVTVTVEICTVVHLTVAVVVYVVAAKFVIFVIYFNNWFVSVFAFTPGSVFFADSLCRFARTDSFCFRSTLIFTFLAVTGSAVACYRTLVFATAVRSVSVIVGIC